MNCHYLINHLYLKNNPKNPPSLLQMTSYYPYLVLFPWFQHLNHHLLEALLFTPSFHFEVIRCILHHFILIDLWKILPNHYLHQKFHLHLNPYCSKSFHFHFVIHHQRFHHVYDHSIDDGKIFYHFLHDQ